MINSRLCKITFPALMAAALLFSDHTHATRAADAPSTQPAASAGPPSRGNSSDRWSKKNRGNSTPAARTSPSPQSIMDAIAPLRTRSIFIKGNQSVANNDSSDMVPGSRSVATGTLVGRRESALVFNGVTVVDDEADALIEDTSSNKVSTVRPGDPIAGGKVSRITFDDLTYEVGGVAKHVSIGQTLDGETPSFASSPGATAPPPTATGSSPDTAATASPPTGAAPSGASADEILARMKAKRLRELTGK